MENNIKQEYLGLASSNRYKQYREIIDKYAREAHLKYVLDMGERIKNIMPIKDGNSIVISNCPNFKDEMDTIKEYTNIAGMQGKSTVDRKEKMQIINQIWALMLDDFIKIIKENPQAYLIGCMSELEYNRFVAACLVMWCKNGFYEKTHDTVVNQMLESMEFIKKMNDMMPPNGGLTISTIYVDVENLISTDEHSLERAIEIIFFILKREGKAIQNNKNKYRFSEVLRLSRAMFYIQSIKLEMLEGDYKNKDLKINGEGEIVLLDRYNESLKKKYYGSMKNKDIYKQDTEEYANNRLDKIAKKHIGVSLTEIISLLDAIDIDYLNDDEFLVGSIDEWRELFKTLTKEETRFFDFMCLKEDIKNVYIEEAIRKNRAARNCLVPTDNMIICPIGLFKYAIMSLYIDILEGEVGDNNFRQEIQACLQERDEQFEVDIYNCLISQLKANLVKHDIREKDIRVNKKLVVLPGQIDVLLLYKKQIFIIECKNTGMRITIKSNINTKNKLTVNKYKSPQNKLDDKVKTVINNKKEIVEHMGGEWNEYVDAPTKGVIVTRYFIDVDNNEDKYPVVSWDKLIEWIEDNIDND